MFGELPDRRNDGCAKQREVACVERKRHFRQPRDNPVEQPIGGAKQHTFFTRRSSRVYDVCSSLVMSKQLGDDFGFILEIAIHQYHGVPGGMIQRSAESRLMSEIAGQCNDFQPAVAPGGVLQELSCPIRAAVVDEHHLMGASGQRVQHWQQPRE
jgi:hypothetical protein